MSERKQPIQITPERFEKFRRIIGALGRDLGVDQHSVDDVIQDTMIRVMQGYDPDGIAMTRYVHLVARGRLIQVLRKCAKSPTGEILDLKDELMEEVPESAEGPRTHVLSREEAEVVDQAIASLQDDMRRFAEMRYDRGLTFEQIGAELGLTAEQVDTLAKRTRREFKRALALYFQTALGDPTKFRVLDTALGQMSDFYKDPFMWRHANKLSIKEIVERTRKIEPGVQEGHIEQRLKIAYKMIPSLKGVGPEGWSMIRSLLRIDPKTGWTDETSRDVRPARGGDRVDPARPAEEQ
jgi:RNA polymerase sigma factor (sigma-70 family)